MVSITTQPLVGIGAMMMPPPTPLSALKRPSYGLKRDSSYLDTDDEAGLSSKLKRTKVAFDPQVDVRIMDDSWNSKSLDLVRQEVSLGIERHLAASQDDSQYVKLIQTLHHDPHDGESLNSASLLKYIVALESRVSRLGECERLVKAALDLSWLGRDDVCVQGYIRFLVSLATAHAKYLQGILDRLVANFTGLPSRSGRLPGEEIVTRSKMFSRTHTTLKTLIRQIPAASSSLVKALKHEYPVDSATTRSYQQYQRHMLSISEYAQEIKTEILAMIVQRVVSLDVQIQQDIEDLEEEAEEKILQRGGQQEDVDDSDDSDNDSVSSSEETYTEDEERLRELRMKVAKMDSTMNLLFEHYDPIMKDGTHADDSEAFAQLLNHFATFVLPNRTRHAQFLLFHYSQISIDHITLFAQRCIEQGFGDGVSAQRYTAIAYLSSFVARGAHVPRSTVQEIFGILCDYLEQMRKRYEPSCRGPDRRTYMLYYAVAQALLYVFCFRWRDLVVHDHEEEGDESEEDDILADVGELRWMPGIKETLQKNIFGPMNPLKVCSPAIVTEFANIARHVRFMEVLSKIESNKRLRLGQTFSYYGLPGGIDVGRRETAWDRKTGDSHHQLEPYFPFDPYHLPSSKKWVEGDYNEWKLPRGMIRDDDEDGFHDDEDESENDSDDESVVGLDSSLPLETLSNSS